MNHLKQFVKSERNLLAVGLLCLSLLFSACGKIPYPGDGQCILFQPATPQGDTVVNSAETQMGASVGFDSSVLQTIKSVVGSPLKPFERTSDAKESLTEQKDAQSSMSNPPGPDASQSADANTPGNQTAPSIASTPPTFPPVQGVECQFSDTNNQETGTRYVEQLRKKLPPGYTPFETEDERQQDAIAVIKGYDWYEPIRLAATASSGLLASRSTEEIINKLKEWRVKYPLHIVTAKHDTAVVILEKVPDDPLPLSAAARKFAPGDGSAHATDFANDIVENRRIFLWFHS